MMEQMPVFVRIAEPLDVRGTMDLLRKKINETNQLLNNINSLMTEESAKIDEWKSKFHLINDKISDITNTLIEPESV